MVLMVLSPASVSKPGSGAVAGAHHRWGVSRPPRLLRPGLAAVGVLMGKHLRCGGSSSHGSPQ